MELGKSGKRNWSDGEFAGKREMEFAGGWIWRWSRVGEMGGIVAVRTSTENSERAGNFGVRSGIREFGRREMKCKFRGKGRSGGLRIAGGSGIGDG